MHSVYDFKMHENCFHFQGGYFFVEILTYQTLLCVTEYRKLLTISCRYIREVEHFEHAAQTSSHFGKQSAIQDYNRGFGCLCFSRRGGRHRFREPVKLPSWWRWCESQSWSWWTFLIIWMTRSKLVKTCTPHRFLSLSEKRKHLSVP